MNLYCFPVTILDAGDINIVLVLRISNSISANVIKTTMEHLDVQRTVEKIRERKGRFSKGSRTGWKNWGKFVQFV